MEGVSPGNSGTGEGGSGKGTTRPPDHDLGSAPSEREQKNPPGVCALFYEVNYAMGEGVGFAGAGAGDDEKRRGGRGSGRELRSVQHEAPNISRSILRANEVDQTDALYRI